MTAPLTLVDIGRPKRADAPPVTLTIDGHAVSVPAGTTILSAAARLGITIPTLVPYRGSRCPAQRLVALGNQCSPPLRRHRGCRG